MTITEKDEALALPLAKKRRALLPVEEMLPEEILAFCPACKTLEVIRFGREGLIATRKFAQRADKVCHCCGSSAACRLHGPAGHTGPDATGKGQCQVALSSIPVATSHPRDERRFGLAGALVEGESN